MTHPATPDQHPVRAYMALISGILCIGMSGIFVKVANLPGPVSAFYRMFFAAVVLLPLWLARVKRHPQGQDLGLILAGGCFLALDLALWNTSLLLIPAATATLLANNAPLWVGLASWIIFREHLGKVYWLGLALALGGMVALLGFDAVRHLHLDKGSSLAILASVFYAVYLLTTQRARSRVDLVTFMALSTLCSLALLFLINLGMGHALTGFSTRAWLALAGLGLVSHLGGWLGINYALGHLRAAPVSVWLLGQVLVTVLVAMPLLGEYPTLSHLLGGVLVLAGILCVTQRQEHDRIQVPE